jgi:hypothetical protein
VLEDATGKSARLVAGFRVLGAPDLAYVSPTIVPREGSVMLALYGVNFRPGQTAWLSRRAYAPINASSITYVSSSEYDCVFDLTGAAAGRWNVVLQFDGATADSLKYGVQIVPIPTVTVLAPNGGEHLVPGTSANAEWQGASEGNGLDHFDVYLSTDGGGTYPTVLGAVDAETFSLVFMVPAVMTTTGRLRVTATDVDGFTGRDDSDGDFAVSSATAVADDPRLRPAPREFGVTSPCRIRCTATCGGRWSYLVRHA